MCNAMLRLITHSISSSPSMFSQYQCRICPKMMPPPLFPQRPCIGTSDPLSCLRITAKWLLTLGNIIFDLPESPFLACSPFPKLDRRRPCSASHYVAPPSPYSVHPSCRPTLSNVALALSSADTSGHQCKPSSTYSLPRSHGKIAVRRGDDVREMNRLNRRARRPPSATVVADVLLVAVHIPSAERPTTVLLALVRFTEPTSTTFPFVTASSSAPQ
ncbi:hypothetical protein PIB30_018589 [Stylosanthes scabra]|uniref:Uncharacterized protein n=1 Tax=Stylosanthes scabra TaxID=79078 RepID=A0ABU6R8A5_9FABA|nr:hypothetical protein [Stylosanthes scabra]